MFTNWHRSPRCTLAPLTAALTATIVAIGLISAAPAQAATLGNKPTVENPTRFQLRALQMLQWSAVRGAVKYEVFVKQAAYTEDLPRNWSPLQTVTRTPDGSRRSNCATLASPETGLVSTCVTSNATPPRCTATGVPRRKSMDTVEGPRPAGLELGPGAGGSMWH